MGVKFTSNNLKTLLKMVLTIAAMKSTKFCNVKPCSLVEVHHVSEKSAMSIFSVLLISFSLFNKSRLCDDGSGMFRLNFCDLLQDCKVSLFIINTVEPCQQFRAVIHSQISFLKLSPWSRNFT